MSPSSPKKTDYLCAQKTKLNFAHQLLFSPKNCFFSLGTKFSQSFVGIFFNFLCGFGKFVVKDEHWSESVKSATRMENRLFLRSED